MAVNIISACVTTIRPPNKSVPLAPVSPRLPSESLIAGNDRALPWFLQRGCLPFPRASCGKGWEPHSPREMPCAESTSYSIPCIANLRSSSAKISGFTRYETPTVRKCACPVWNATCHVRSAEVTDFARKMIPSPEECHANCAYRQCW